MKKSITIAAIAGLAAAATAQDVVFWVDGAPAPADPIAASNGDTFVVDVVLDATGYQGDFFAWHQYNFNINMSGPATASDIGGDLAESDFLETADTTGVGAAGNAWTGGRRPGAFPGSASNNGGNRFGGDTGSVVSDSGITGPAATIGGRQQAPAAPENNSLINQSRQYEVYRFQYTYNGNDGLVEFTLADAVINVYPALGAFNEFIAADQIGSVSFGIPTPATAGILGLGGLVAARRRRA
ncbi:MAG: hypothetical protein AAGK04_05665 [Planctomycetota bacterium]